MNNRRILIVVAAGVLIFCKNSHSIEPEKPLTGWSIYVDNDLFAFDDSDKEYTGGIAVKRAGTTAKADPLSIDTWLGSIDSFSNLSDIYNRPETFKTHSIEYGLTLFTPKDLDIPDPIPDQHPYASLAFVSNTRLIIDTSNLTSYQSTLTVGLIGLSIAGDVQKVLHDITGATEPLGWDNQISAGGEPTFRYSVSRSRNHTVGEITSSDLELKTSLEANLGFTTDLGVSFSLRWGKLQTPWWAFNVHSAEYISMGSLTSPSLASGNTESYIWFGVSLKYRLYNAFLEGQFRSSEVTYDRDELEDLIAEAWLGYTYEFESRLHLSVLLRGRTQEIDLPGLSNPVWGGFIISKSY